MAFKPRRVGLWESLTRKRVKSRAYGPYCYTCRHFILIAECTPKCPRHGYELVDNTFGMPASEILLRCRCHGAEEVQRIDLGSAHWDHDDLLRAAQRVHWFEPKEAVQP